MIVKNEGTVGGRAMSVCLSVCPHLKLFSGSQLYEGKKKQLLLYYKQIKSDGIRIDII